MNQKEKHLKNQNPDEKQLYQRLTKQIQKSQHQTSRRFLFLGFNEKIKGLFESYIYTDPFNLHNYTKRSPRLRLPDNNAFVSFWTLDLLLEAFKDNTDYLQDFHLEDTVKNLIDFHDHTREPDDPLFLFWKQQKIDGKWVSNAGNLTAAYPMWKAIDKSKEKITKPFSKSSTQPDNGVHHPSNEPKRSSALFCLPADFDDSALNWTLGSSLFQLRGAFPELWSAWSANNFDFNKLAYHAVEYAYRPFSNDKNVNAIDPRTFYAIREFLWEIEKEGAGTSEFMLLTTWAATAQGNLQGIEHYYKMPFNVNNLDVSVSANFVYAAMKSALAESFPCEAEEFPALVKNTAKFLVWALKSGAIMDKPDLLLLYYPSPFLAFFFISRTVYILQQPHQRGKAELVQQIRDLLLPTARTKITEYLLSSVQCEGEYAFWDGASLETDATLSRQHHNDRKFTTALSINTLLNLWTIRQDTGVDWLDQTPKEVPALVKKGINWLRNYAFSKKYPDHNAFFSSSVKHPDSLPFLFPTNIAEQVNAPVFRNKSSEKKASHEGHSIFALSGVPSRENYEQALKEKGLTNVDPYRFKRCYELEFPYWSAPSVVYALICLAITKGSTLKL
ncbi:MAG: hypothetical protein NWF01_00225 [Candidatus Bathyarchaeota archaeon]|nr:hypothetical protein [Candidatus Bathyarchaeota archaeon]